MNDILFPALAVGAIGLLFGILLAIASKVFHVDVDERIPEISALLPGANCGGCGFAGCDALAKAIVEGTSPATACAVASSEAIASICEIMGTEAVASEKKIARVRCAGTCEAAPDKYVYDGLSDCRAAALIAGGPKGCSYGCMGLGTCVNVCAFDALSIKDGIAYVDAEKCTGCGTCVAACPKHIITLEVKGLIVNCNSLAHGRDMKGICSVGCIGCGICAKNCPAQAITVENNLARIDREKCTSCGLCVEKCPKHIIF